MHRFRSLHLTVRVVNAPIRTVSERERDSIPEIDVTYVASLARLELTDEETARFQEQLASIVSFVDTLSSLDVEGVAPTAHPAPLLDCFREDKPSEGLVRDQFLRNTPDSGLNQVRVPKVVDS